MDKAGTGKILREKITMLERKLGLVEDTVLNCCGITVAQCHAVVELGRADGVSLNNLASSLNLENSTVSRTVNNLVKSELAGREEDAEDRRYVSISLTDKGKKIYENIESSMEVFFADIVSRIPDEKHEQVLESLQILLDAIGEDKCCK